MAKKSKAIRIPVKFPQERAEQFARDIARDNRDAIWQPDWLALRFRASDVAQNIRDAQEGQ